MENIISFLHKVGVVKRLKQRGLVLRGVIDPVSVGAHSFREAILGWLLAQLGRTGFDTNRIIKLVLVHDLCAGYGGDLTPYEPLLKSASKEDLKKIFVGWVRLSKKEKERFYKKQREQEHKALKELTKDLPPMLSGEINSLWNEYEKGITNEGRFVQQIDMLENFLQALEYWKEDQSFPIESWWHQMKELVSDPILVKFLEGLDFHYYQNSAKKRGRLEGKPL